ncbi:hypothetical protein [Sorangium sp. So ce1182]|uniref:hypothetical protein n=1 Tax=Sorangium sp. So ce1182 TaxID=3133334 RepID=UPI003F61D579
MRRYSAGQVRRYSAGQVRRDSAGALIILDSPFQNGARDGDVTAATVCPFPRARPALLLKA